MTSPPSGVGRIIHYYVHGRGRGHATRSRAIIRRLQHRGHAVRVFAGRDALPILQPVVVSCTAVQSLPARPGIRSITLGVRRVAQAVRAGWNEVPDVLVSDGDHPSVIAAKILRRPVIAVGHGLVFSRCRRPPSLDRPSWLREAVKATVSSWPADGYVAVNFVPLPLRDRRTVLARPVLDDRLHQPAPLAQEAGSPTVLCYFRDDNGDDVTSVLRRVARDDIRILVFGRGHVKGVEYRPRDRLGFIEELRRCDQVVASAGSQLISECLALHKPLFVLHQADDDEQRLNLAMLRAVGAGDGCAFSEINEQRLSRFLQDAPQPSPELRAWAAPDAAEAVMTLVEEVA